jgi:hypothetical protein
MTKWHRMREIGGTRSQSHSRQCPSRTFQRLPPLPAESFLKELTGLLSLPPKSSSPAPMPVLLSPELDKRIVPLSWRLLSSQEPTGFWGQMPRGRSTSGKIHKGPIVWYTALAQQDPHLIHSPHIKVAKSKLRQHPQHTT